MMNNQSNGYFFQVLFKNKSLYIIIGILILIACFSYVSVNQETTSMYKYIKTLTELPIIHFMLLPIFLCLLTIVFQAGWTNTYAILKYKNRRNYLYALIMKLCLTSIFFVVLIYGLFFIIGFTFLETSNEWLDNDFLNTDAEGHRRFTDIKPLTYMLISATLLFSLCMTISLFYLIAYLKFKNILKALMSAFVLVFVFSLSWIFRVFPLIFISPYVFMDIRFYFKTFFLNALYPLSFIYVYWLVFIAAFTYISIRLIKKEDLLPK